jgi:hypothetical protein
VPVAGGFRKNGTAFRHGERWLLWEKAGADSGATSLNTESRAGVPPANGRRDDSPSLGQPGLWRAVASGISDRQVFEVPAKAVATEDDNEGDAPGLPSFLEWASETAQGRLPAGWCPPSREAVLAMLPPEALTWRRGPFVRQGELLLGPSRWSFRFPILPRMPHELPPVREQSLRELCLEAQSCWRMVRVGVASLPDGRALLAEVDLSGAPPVAPLVLTSLDGLKFVTGWLVEVAELLADVSVTLRVLETDGVRTLQERTER